MQTTKSIWHSARRNELWRNVKIINSYKFWARTISHTAERRMKTNSNFATNFIGFILYSFFPFIPYAYFYTQNLHSIPTPYIQTFPIKLLPLDSTTFERSMGKRLDYLNEGHNESECKMNEGNWGTLSCGGREVKQTTSSKAWKL